LDRQLAATVVLVIVSMVSLVAGVHFASEWLGSDARAIEDCQATHFTCVSTVAGRARIEALRGPPPQFEGVAKNCAEHVAWETANFRANFDCEMSSRVEHGSCEEVETSCELSAG
jgi:hypothetical protein